MGTIINHYHRIKSPTLFDWKLPVAKAFWQAIMYLGRSTWSKRSQRPREGGDDETVKKFMQESAEKHDMQRKHTEAAGVWCCFWLKVVIFHIDWADASSLFWQLCPFHSALESWNIFMKCMIYGCSMVFPLCISWSTSKISRHLYRIVWLSGFQHIVWPEAPDDAKVWETWSRETSEPPVLGVSKLAPQNPMF